MAAGRPDVAGGIGQKPKFSELGLELTSHKAAEFATDKNVFEIEFRSANPLKTSCKLSKFKEDGSEEEISEGVFTQWREGKLTFHVAMPEPAWHKLNIFGTKVDGENEGIPHVFTYLINLTKTTEAAKPFPKQFADFNRGCYLHRPLFIDSSKDMSKVVYKVTVPGAKKVAVKAGEEWFQLTKQSGDKWEGEANLAAYKGKDVSVSLNAALGDDETQYATLLQYTV